MLRDRLKTLDYFTLSIEKREKLIEKNITLVNKGLVAEERILSVKEFRISSYKNNLIAKYSRGDNMNSEETISDFINAVTLMNEIWSPKLWNMRFRNSKKETVILDQYTLSGFIDFSRLLSLTVLLEIPQDYVFMLAKFIDGDNLRDFLLEFFLKYLITERKDITNESYSNFFHVNERYNLLKEIVSENDKVKAQEKLRYFLEKKWYNSLKDTTTYNSHNNPHNIYVGYWCFQAAAITKIMNLDDSSYRDNEYYPKDLL